MVPFGVGIEVTFTTNISLVIDDMHWDSKIETCSSCTCVVRGTTRGETIFLTDFYLKVKSVV